MFIDLKFVDAKMQRGKERVFEALKADRRNRFIGDTVAEMENWTAYQPPKPIKPPSLLQTQTGQPVRTDRKIGRNVPCPCGSGLKYKRCCEREDETFGRTGLPNFRSINLKGLYSVNGAYLPLRYSCSVIK